jgi:hypothetical protein
MELKHVLAVARLSRHWNINRTFMELKRQFDEWYNAEMIEY